MRFRKRQSPQKLSPTKLTEMMYERLKCLQEDELASLATIVATCGLNAALAEGTIRNSSVDYLKNGPMRKSKLRQHSQVWTRFWLNNMTKLEREVQEARSARKNESAEGNNQEKVVDLSVRDRSDDRTVSSETIPDLGSILVKHSSKLEKEIEDMKRKDETLGKEMNAVKFGKGGQMKQEIEEVPSLDKFLVKHVSRLEREVQETKNRRRDALAEGCTADSLKKKGSSDEGQIGSIRKCNLNNKVTPEIEQNGSIMNLAEENIMQCSDEPFDQKGDKGHQGGNLEEEESSPGQDLGETSTQAGEGENAGIVSGKTNWTN
ncbi:hypothetical protein Ancab_017640 [Ancistrocladus abbreviatus]